MSRRLQTVLLDLDDCLYQIEAIPHLMLERIQDYMKTKLGIPPENIDSLSSNFYMNFGTTLAGLVANGYTIDYDDWHQHVHGTLPYELVTRNEPLRSLLLQVGLPMYVFTNADDKHAAVCLERMGIADLFRGVITFERIQEAGRLHGKVHHGVPVVCKPARLAFEYALQAAGGADASTSVFFDDSARNVSTAASLGIYSVLVGRVGVNCDADAELLSLLDLPTAAPELWKQMTTGVATPLPSLQTKPEEHVVEARQASDTMPTLMRRLSMEGGTAPQQRSQRVDVWINTNTT